MEECIMKDTGECQGILVADLVIQAKVGGKNISPPLSMPLCLFHAIKGGAYSWLANQGEAIIWDIVKSINPEARKGLHLTHKVVVREPWRTILKSLGI